MTLHTFHFDSLESFKTYAGCYESWPAASAVLESIKIRALTRWGDRPIHIFNGQRYQEADRLPSWCHMCLFYSHSPVNDPTAHGSELLVVWFSDKWVCYPDEVIAQGDWNKYARDFFV